MMISKCGGNLTRKFDASYYLSLPSRLKESQSVNDGNRGKIHFKFKNRNGSIKAIRQLFEWIDISMLKQQRAQNTSNLQSSPKDGLR
jgi:hypothetical protein